MIFNKNTFQSITLGKEYLNVFLLNGSVIRIDFFTIQNVYIKFLKTESIISYLIIKEYHLVFLVKSGTTINIKLPIKCKALVIGKIRVIKILISL